MTIRISIFAALIAVLFSSCALTDESAYDVTAAPAVTYPNVQLDYAIGSYSWVSGYDNIATAAGNIIVKNLAYTKKVIVHWTSNGTTWVDTPATFSQSISDNREVWKFGNIGNIIFQPYWGSSATIKFAVKYIVNGATYWDNNGGADYTVYFGGRGQNPANYFPYFALGTQIKAISSSYYVNGTPVSNILYATLGLKNLGYNKTVGVRVTTNNWKSYIDVPAVYQQGFATNLIETWTVTKAFPAKISNIQFAAYYTVNGVTYWDNNYSKNYSLKVQ